LSALRTRRTLLPRNIIILMFLSEPQGLVRPEASCTAFPDGHMVDNKTVNRLFHVTRNIRT
jgi:hypothetical protein